MRRARLHLPCCVKLLCILTCLVVILANIHILTLDRGPGVRQEKLEDGKRKPVLLKENDSVRPGGQGDPGPEPAGGDNSLAGDRVHGLPNSTEKDDTKYGEDTQINITEILHSIHTENTNQDINNSDLYGPVTNSTVILVVQVHNRYTYLRELINSLSLATDIQNTLLIFSHDVWDEQINSLVRSIDFTKTLQIFYPYSLQTHPNTFPGESPEDCPRDMSNKKPSTLKCTNSAWPDIYGHYREAKFTQTKHHWWWKANHIFYKLKVTRHFTGSVVFLEEDHYVAEDFLHILAMMQYEQENNYSQVDILCLGTYLRKFNYKANSKQPGLGPGLLHLQGLPPFARSLKSLTNGNYQHRDSLQTRHLLWAPSFLNSLLSMFHKELQFWEGGPRYSKLQKAEVGQWISSKHNMGMVFTRVVWDKIRRCADLFCKYDDYNWDWSLQHISLNCIKEKLQVMMIKGPRVFHIGECGVHHKKSDCNSNLVMGKVKNILKTAKTFLFPTRLSVGRAALKKKVKLKKGNGGWGDKRDHALCNNMTSMEV